MTRKQSIIQKKKMNQFLVTLKNGKEKTSNSEGDIPGSSLLSRTTLPTKLELVLFTFEMGLPLLGATCHDAW